jgi:hypothetical protein
MNDSKKLINVIISVIALLWVVYCLFWGWGNFFGLVGDIPDIITDFFHNFKKLNPFVQLYLLPGIVICSYFFVAKMSIHILKFVRHILAEINKIDNSRMFFESLADLAILGVWALILTICTIILFAVCITGWPFVVYIIYTPHPGTPKT